MSDSMSAATETALPQEVAPAAAVSAGALLRQARQAQGVALEDLAATLKVPVEKLQALEDEDWQRLPDVVFLRALAQTICRTLHLEAAPVLALLPQQKVTALAPQGGLNAPMRERGVPSILATNTKHSPWPWVVLLLIVLGGGGYLGVQWMAPEWVRGVSTTVSAPSDPAGDSPLFSPAVPEEGDGGGMGNMGDVAQAGEVPTVQAAALMQPALPEEEGAQPGFAAPAPAAEPAAAPAAQAAASVSPVLRITAKGATWVQVLDAQQRLLIEKILQDGEVFSTSAPKPLTVAVGKADLATVEVNGAPFDVQAVARSNVARFEVK
ncbi:MAG: helix-turn-helix domain-containing protein [Burkholderiaceae bacterium]|jgi:cytoskeleton protein RodZ|uniref:helix-turn-helix domain-containing protein n=1 Tax=Comamonas denitrificans TaxID=117506 RepID=UPI001B523663|nr:helix-turn-helix domain-containing protein [Comamonas sp.]MBP7789902.1 helix-turn-helix domain-containing protein [Comamonas sp.]MBP8053897.1 helix-turn-helix domain-containing protein [Burkholderiaceae bacterium]